MYFKYSFKFLFYQVATENWQFFLRMVQVDMIIRLRNRALGGTS